MSRISLGVTSLATRAVSSLPVHPTLGSSGRINLVRSSSIAVRRSLGRRYLSTSPRTLSETTSEQKSHPNPGASSSGSVPFWRRGIQIQWIFGGLAGLGALITIYGLSVILQIHDHAAKI